jgi:hypothetical protein
MSSTSETEAARSQVRSQPGLQRETLVQKATGGGGEMQVGGGTEEIGKKENRMKKNEEKKQERGKSI